MRVDVSVERSLSDELHDDDALVRQNGFDLDHVLVVQSWKESRGQKIIQPICFSCHVSTEALNLFYSHSVGPILAS